MGVDAERMLQSIHTNFVSLKHRVLMAQVEDLPEVMQRHVVGVPRAWVRLFRWLARAIVTFHDHNPPPPPQDQIPGSLYILYYRVLYVGGSRAPILYHDAMYSHILDIYKKFMVIGLFIYMCKNCVCDEFIVYETNANLTRSQHMSQQLDY